MTTEQIINSTLNKTQKITALLETGKTRKEVATLMNVGYGFVQNVYAKMQNPNRTNTTQVLSFVPSTFNKKFGIEIESYAVPKNKLLQALRLAGINVEDEAYNHNTRPHWKIVSDSSINGDNTFELVSPPLQGQSGLDEVKIVSQVLTRLGAKINKTCGMHVHFEAINFDLQQWKNIFINYANLETTIDDFMPQSRRANNAKYCQSIIKYKTAIANATAITDFKNIMTGRYYKINPQSFSRHKTIEFRQHCGTIEFEKIEKWILFLHNLIDYSKNYTINNGNFETLKTFNQQEVTTFYHHRTQDLAA
jgi:hypothetical protein